MTTAHRDTRRGLGSLPPFDQLIVGALFLFLLVFVFELMLVVPCGGWAALSSCETALMKDGAWSGYFEIDPYWATMPAWYATVMNLQDVVYNPFWLLSLGVYWLHRQDTAWFRTATIVVSSMIITSSVIVFCAQLAHPDITASKLLRLFLVNSPWVVFPGLFILRMHRSARDAAVPQGA